MSHKRTKMVIKLNKFKETSQLYEKFPLSLTVINRDMPLGSNEFSCNSYELIGRVWDYLKHNPNSRVVLRIRRLGEERYELKEDLYEMIKGHNDARKEGGLALRLNIRKIFPHLKKIGNYFKKSIKE